MDNKKFYDLCRRAWAIQTLAAIADGRSARISSIAHQLGAGRTAMTATFHHLLEQGYLQRSGGHGHPLRPEFELTAQGQRVGAWALSLSGEVDSKHDWHLIRKTWTLPILRLTADKTRYGELRRALTPITDRALSLSISTLTHDGWLSREVASEQVPPQVLYMGQGKATALTPHLQQSFHLG